MTAEKPSAHYPEWTKLAEETLELWQDYLSATASDPKAKAELVKLAEPLMGLGQTMFTEWTKMLQSSAYGQSAPAPAGSPAAPAAATAANPASPQHLAQLASRVVELERQLAELESQLAEPADAAGKAAATAGTASNSAKPARRGRRAAPSDHDSGH